MVIVAISGIATSVELQICKRNELLTMRHLIYTRPQAGFQLHSGKSFPWLLALFDDPVRDILVDSASPDALFQSYKDLFPEAKVQRNEFPDTTKLPKGISYTCYN